MAIKFNRSQTFSTNGTVTAAGLHNLIDGTDIYQALITDQPSLTAVDPADSILIADASLTAGDAPRQTTVSNLFDDALTGGTYTNLNLTGALTFGTATGNRTISTSATITTGTITTGLIPTLTAGTTTGTAGIFTSGTVTTLNSTTGTIVNLSTTLAGDFTISQGTGTLGTTGATLGTYGGATSVPVLAIDAKGRVTTASTSAIVSNTGFRNRIINGDMRIDQRNAGASVTPTNAQYLVDRFAATLTQASKYTAQQNAGSITPPTGFSNYLGITSLSSYSVLTGDTFGLYQYIEGFNASDLAWGTGSASAITLSFWVRSSLTGTFGGAFGNNAQNRSYPFSYTISSANTWTKITITISGDTSGTWPTDNSVGIAVRFGLGSGATYSGTSGAWAAGNFIQPTSTVSVVGTNGATFYITGVQLEAGSTATEFERRPYGTELALCQRYYAKIGPYVSGSSYYQGFGTAGGESASLAFGIFTAPVPMRSSPTFTSSGTLALYSNGFTNISSFGNAYYTNSVVGININVASGLTAGRFYSVLSNGDANAFVQFTSEL
jgi:hypothetical protein